MECEVSGRYTTLYQEENWAAMLSGGERQRLALARMCFHARRDRVKFAICDEPLSAVSKESIQLLLSVAKGEGVTLVTVSHSTEIDLEHKMRIHLTKDGSWVHETV